MITLNQHKVAVTKRIIATFSDAKSPKMGLGTFFKKVTTSEKTVSIEVERNRQLVAADVQRGTDANLNTFDKYSEKLYIPPYFQEGFNFVDLDRYNVTFGNNSNPSASDALNMINQAERKLKILKSKIERAIEKQHSQALQTGIVTMVNGDNVNFNRKAGSIVAIAGGLEWDNANGLPLNDLENGAKWLRQEGLSGGAEVDCIMGAGAFREFMNNVQVTKQADIRRIDRITLSMPRLDNTTGLSFHGQIAVFDFKVNIWTYSDFYEELNGTKTPYIDDKNIVMIPQDFEGITAYAGIPAIMRDSGNAEYPEYISQIEADFYINNYIDPRKKAHMFEIASAPLAIPYSIDRLYTAQVLA